MALNENIRKLREENNLTQQQLADKLYVSRQTICRWESGSRCPDLITAKKLAVEFNVSLDDLISNEDIRKFNMGRFDIFFKVFAQDNTCMVYDYRCCNCRNYADIKFCCI